jgi:hypothetical protein
MRLALVVGMMALGCTTRSAAPAGSAPVAANDQLTLRTASGPTQMSLGPDGQIMGPTIQLTPTDGGYRGVFESRLVDLRSNGERISGTVHDRMVDLHVEVVDDRLVARGLFGGRLGRLEASNLRIRNTLGICSYDLQARATRYEGHRACRTRSMPMPHPVAIELPPGFERLRPDRQLMLLAILLSD